MNEDPEFTKADPGLIFILLSDIYRLTGNIHGQTAETTNDFE